MKSTLPDKLFYKIGEVAELTGLEPYVLRYWEGEFGLKLTKSKNSQRLYQKKDIDQILRIKTLLYDEKFTIAGAKKRLREKKKMKGDDQLALLPAASEKPSAANRELLHQVSQELETMMKMLSTSTSGHA